LRQILVNLIGNAVKFTSTGDILVEVRRDRTETAPSTGEEIGLHFLVRDTGIGVPEDKLGRLFLSFTQVDASTTRQYGGTGLGLAISKRLTELLGGRMWVESKVGEGSVFQFTIRTLETGFSTDVSAVVAAAVPLTGLRCLVVDDNATNRRVLSVQAAKWGMATRLADSGAQALAALQSNEVFDVAVIDMQMPGMDGLATAQAIRALGFSFPMMLLTSIPVDKGPGADRFNVFAGIHNKPVKPVQLQMALGQIMDGTRSETRRAVSHTALDATLAERLPMRLLVVDDNMINQKVALRLLKQFGYFADVAANGLEAVAAVSAHCYDIAFMDVQMPELDGLEASRRIRQLPTPAARTVIIAMTANAMRGDRERCLEAGMDDYIPKPVRPSELQAALERWGQEIRARGTGALSASPRPAVRAEQSAAASAPQIGAPVAEEAPVDLERMTEFTDGDPAAMRELIELYLTQTSQQFGKLEAAVQAANATEVRRLAHSSVGSSATCGMRAIVPVLRELEQRAQVGNLEGATELIARARSAFERIRVFLENHESPGPRQRSPFLCATS